SAPPLLPAPAGIHPAPRAGLRADSPLSSATATIPFAARVAGLPAEGAPTALRHGPTLTESKNRAERSLIAQALERNGQNRLRAAADLGISRMTIYKKLHKYGLMGA